jgi:hypothetical protein
VSRDDRADPRPPQALDRLDDRPTRTTSSVRTDDFASRGLDLPRDHGRERVEFRGRAFSLNNQESRLLATTGAFRVVSTEAVDYHQVSASAVRHLKSEGLLTEHSLTDRAGVRHVLSLTPLGKTLLESRREPSDTHRQEFYAGMTKPREVAHDSRLYEVFLKEAAELEREGCRVVRVALDYELKRDYQRYLNRPDRPGDASSDEDRQAFAQANGLQVTDGRIALPDVRIHYEGRDGDIEFRDVELVTEHYSRSQLNAKSAAGFVRYGSTSGPRANARTRASGAGTPIDPRHLARLL